MSETEVNAVDSTLCPKCGNVLHAIANQSDVVCPCGFIAFAPYVLEADYLRKGLPKWQARLAELDDAISGGLRPAGAAQGDPSVSPKPATGAYQYLVGGGSILLFAGLAAFVGIMWRYLGMLGQGAVLALITVVLGGLANRLATRIQSTATALSALTVGSWLIDMGWLLSRFYTHLATDSRLLSTLIIPTLLSISTAIVFVFVGKRFENPIWQIFGQVFIPVSVGLALTSIELNIAKSSAANSLHLAALALPLTVSILLLVANGDAVQRIFSSLSRNLAVVIFSIFTFGFVVASVQADDTAAIAWASHLALLAIFAYAKPKLQNFSPLLIAAAVVLSAGFTGFPISIRVASPALLGLISFRFGKASKVSFPLLLAATNVAWIVYGFAVNPVSEFQPYAIGLSAFTGLLLTIQGWNFKRSEYVAIGSAFIALAIILTNTHLEIVNLEAFTLPVAFTFLIGGLIAYRINSTLSSLLWLGPSCAAALLPSASRATQSLEYSTRFTASLVTAIALLVVGARLRYLGMLVVGLFAVIILVQNPITSLFNAVQPWIIFTLAGLLLLLLGARFEHLRKRAVVAKAWISGSLR